MANKYLFLYSGGNPPKSEAEGKAVMSAWMAWFGKVGPNVVDGGAPFAPGAKTVGGASPSLRQRLFDHHGGQPRRRGRLDGRSSPYRVGRRDRGIRNSADARHVISAVW